MKSSFAIVANGDSALDIRFDASPSLELSERIIALAQAVEAQRWEGVGDLIPAYQCLTVCYNPLNCNNSDLTNRLESLTRQQLRQPPKLDRKPRLIRVPVCYDAEFAPDMREVSEHTGLSAEQIIARHCAPDYLVHMLGFTPGFLYLGGLDPQLHCPRKATPELRVPAGAVGIGGSQTGIYPQVTPGAGRLSGARRCSCSAPRARHPLSQSPWTKSSFSL
ncbi:5-oxoprolinase subunit PxpB [Microbulbifer taiwanensis]|uniref:5-oxoprolinase subunit PxpB n=1 Tax=Microbulbifer taiwanensis TaxID=986746 RepID=UPI00360ACEE1